MLLNWIIIIEDIINFLTFNLKILKSWKNTEYRRDPDFRMPVLIPSRYKYRKKYRYTDTGKMVDTEYRIPVPAFSKRRALVQGAPISNWRDSGSIPGGDLHLCGPPSGPHLSNPA
jgi:hypothetical protein